MTPAAQAPRLRRAGARDAEALWQMLKPVFRAGDSYAIAPDIDRDGALAYWTGPGREVWLAEVEGAPLGSYYLCANQAGPGDHICNCGFVTAPEARGRGIARAMLTHALERAKDRGFEAMQFNFVLASNRRAVDTWQRAGFDIVGRIPRAFRHPQLGYVEALVMHRAL